MSSLATDLGLCMQNLLLLLLLLSNSWRRQWLAVANIGKITFNHFWALACCLVRTQGVPPGSQWRELWTTRAPAFKCTHVNVIFPIFRRSVEKESGGGHKWWFLRLQTYLFCNMSRWLLVALLAHPVRLDIAMRPWNPHFYLRIHPTNTGVRARGLGGAAPILGQNHYFSGKS